MAPAITAPPMAPAATPAPHPHPPPLHPHPPPRHRHWAEASVALAAKVTAMVATASKLASVFFIRTSLGPAGAEPSTLRRQQADRSCLICRKFGRETCASATWDLGLPSLVVIGVTLFEYVVVSLDQPKRLHAFSEGAQLSRCVLRALNFEPADFWHLMRSWLRP